MHYWDGTEKDFKNFEKSEDLQSMSTYHQGKGKDDD